MSAEDLTDAAAITQLLNSREQFGMQFGLDRIERLTELLGSPQLSYRTIHVVGTNGKTSTTAMLAAILKAHGMKVGTYTSPHLEVFNERISVDQLPVTDAEFLSALETVEESAVEIDDSREGDDRVTQYELLTAAAFVLFQRSQVDIAIVEAGLGGRLDATNVLESELQLLTNVSLDHTELLGATVGEIAREKLAIVPDNGKLIVGDLGAISEQVSTTVEERDASLLRPQTFPAQNGLVSYQRANLALAHSAALEIVGDLDESLVTEALTDLVVRGRFEQIGESPTTLIDGAHNPGGMESLLESLDGVPGSPRILVLSLFRDKDIAGVLSLIGGRFDLVLATTNSNERALSAELLSEFASRAGVTAQAVADPVDALSMARSTAGSEGLVVAAGSLALVGDLSRRLR